MDSRPYRAFVAFFASVLLLLTALVVSGIVPLSSPGNRFGSGPVSSEATGNFDQLVVVLMENKNLNEVYGPAPYMTQLADQYSFSQGWSSITNPSQPNYIAILGASTFGVGGDGNHPNLNHPTLVDLIETSGHTWNAIAEGAGGSGCGLSPPRGEDHFPFLSYTTITSNSARCANLHSGGPVDVVTALNAGTSFIWFTPTDNHNMHDNSVASGDAWIQSWVPGLLTVMGTKKAALIIMFDEAYTSPPYIYMSFSGPATKLAYKSTAAYSHYSLAKLLEDVWGGGSLGQGDVTAPSPLEFFNAGGPDFTLSANPGSVSFFAGQSAASTVSLTASGGFSRTLDREAPGPLGLGVGRDLGHGALLDADGAACVRRSGQLHREVGDPGFPRVLKYSEQGGHGLRLGWRRRRRSSGLRLDGSFGPPGPRPDLHRGRCAIHRRERRPQRDGDDHRPVHHQQLVHRRKSVREQPGDALDRRNQLLCRGREREDRESRGRESVGGVPARP